MTSETKELLDRARKLHSELVAACEHDIVTKLLSYVESLEAERDELRDLAERGITREWWHAPTTESGCSERCPRCAWDRKVE